MIETYQSVQPRADFIWPEYVHERDRIRHNSLKYKDFGLEAAMADAWGIKLGYGTIVDADPCRNVFEVGSFNVGDVVPFRILSITKNNVTLENMSCKEEVVCMSNLGQYKRFKENLPRNPILCLIKKKDNDKIYVDPITPILNSWLNGILTSKPLQYDLQEDRSVTVHNLQLVNGGFVGDIYVDPLTEFLGEPYTMKAFVPGSQIILNRETDFERWVGQDVKAFVMNFAQKNNNNTLVCSRKNYIAFQGQKMLLSEFNVYATDPETWKKSLQPMEGKITGVINSANKCCVFVECTEQNITGAINVEPDQLTSYHNGDAIEVKFDRFDEPMRWNPDAMQMQHVDLITYLTKFGDDDNIEPRRYIRYCNIKPIFTEVK